MLNCRGSKHSKTRCCVGEIAQNLGLKMWQQASKSPSMNFTLTAFMMASILSASSWLISKKSPFASSMTRCFEIDTNYPKLDDDQTLLYSLPASCRRLRRRGAPATPRRSSLTGRSSSSSRRLLSSPWSCGPAYICCHDIMWTSVDRFMLDSELELNTVKQSP